MLKKTSILIFIALVLIAGCSANISEKKESAQSVKKDSPGLSEKAMNSFINGNTADMKGDYASAVLEYQDALTYEQNPGIYYALAKDYFILNKLSLALQNSMQAVKLDSSNIEYFDLLAQIYSSASMKDSAIAVYEKIIQLDSTYAQAYYNLGFLYEQFRPSQAVEIYNKLLEITGPEWSVLVRIAEIYEKLGKQEESISTLEQLVSIDPSNIDLQKVLIDAYLKKKDFEKAMKQVDDLLVMFPDDSPLHELKAQVYLQQNDWTSAAKQYNLLLKDPKIPIDTKIRIGSVYLARSATDSSLLPVVKNLFATMDKDSAVWQVKMILGEIALREKDDSTATEYFKNVINLARWNGDAWIRLGGIYFDAKKYNEVVGLMQEAIQSFPDDFVINLMLGLSYSQLNKYPDARLYLKKATELKPRDITALSAYGYALSQLKQTDEAINVINSALKIEPSNVDLLGTLGLIYNSQKKWKECDSVYARALEIDSSNALVLNNFAYSLAERSLNLDEALKMSQKAVKKDSLNASYLDTIGWVYYQLGKYELAQKYIEKAVELDKNNSTLMEHLGDIAYKSGKANVAVEMWKKALNLNDDNPDLKTKIEKGTL